MSESTSNRLDRLLGRIDQILEEHRQAQAPEQAPGPSESPVTATFPESPVTASLPGGQSVAPIHNASTTFDPLNSAMQPFAMMPVSGIVADFSGEELRSVLLRSALILSQRAKALVDVVQKTLEARMNQANPMLSAAATRSEDMAVAAENQIDRARRIHSRATTYSVFAEKLIDRQIYRVDLAAFMEIAEAEYQG